MQPLTRHEAEPDQLIELASTINSTGGRFIMAYLRYSENIPEVVYLVDQGSNLAFTELVVRNHTRLPSLSEVAPLLNWYEREIMDLSEIEFEGNPEPFPLVLLEGMSLSIGPFNPSQTQVPELFGTPTQPKLPEVIEDQVQDLFWGPVRGDILESGEFHFAYIGEQILHYTPRLFYKHRGIESGLAGSSLTKGLVLAERVSGVGSVSHAAAYCTAIENAFQLEIPARAQLIRIILSELERIYNNFHFFANLCKTTTLKVGEAFGALLEEEAKQINCKVTGNRLLRNVLAVGGLRRDLAVEELSTLLPPLRRKAEDYLEALSDTQSHLDRLIGTGILSQNLAFEFGATGPVANASAISRDLRVNHPYSGYQNIQIDVTTRSSGDALARAEVRKSALFNAFTIIDQALSLIQPGPTKLDNIQVPPGTVDGLGWSEGPRGSCFYAIRIRDGLLERVKIKSASFSNWKVFPLTVHSTNMMDYAINEASFGLTIAGADR